MLRCRSHKESILASHSKEKETLIKRLKVAYIGSVTKYGLPKVFNYYYIMLLSHLLSLKWYFPWHILLLVY